MRGIMKSAMSNPSHEVQVMLPSTFTFLYIRKKITRTACLIRLDKLALMPRPDTQ